MVIRTGHLTIDRDRYLVTVDGRPIRLTYMEFHALLMIAEHSGRVVTYDCLAEALWGSAGPEARRRLAVIVSRVRSKLGEAADAIDTVHASVIASPLRPSRSTDSPRPEGAPTPSGRDPPPQSDTPM